MKLIIIIIINIEKKKMVQNQKWATTHLSRRLGAGLGARHSDTARRRAGGLWAGRAGGRWAGRTGGRWAGRAGRWARRAGGQAAGVAAGAGARGHSAGVPGWARGARTGAGRADGRGARGQARGARTGAGRADGRGARGRARQARRAAARRGAREVHDVGARGARPGRACARRLGVLAGQLGQVGAQCTWLSSDSVFWTRFDSVFFPSH